MLDLFAGTGALGLEALSRGAAHATFVEQGAAALALLRRNLARLKPRRDPGDRARRDPARAQPRPAFDLVFLDPPYGRGLGETALASALAGGWVAPGALVAWEESVNQAAPPGLTLLDRRRYGETMIAIFGAPAATELRATHDRGAPPARPGLRLPRVPPRPGGDRRRRRGPPRRPRHHADRRRQVALLPASGADPPRRHAGRLAADRADARPGPGAARRRGRRRGADLAVGGRRDRAGLRGARRRPAEAPLHGARAARLARHREPAPAHRPRPPRRRRGALRQPMGPRLPPRLPQDRRAPPRRSAMSRPWR